MTVIKISSRQTPTPFLFSSFDRAGKAAKRLKAALEQHSSGTHPLGWYKTILARMVGYPGWEDLRRGIAAGGEPSLLDHEMQEIEAILDRRFEQTRILAEAANLNYEIAKTLIDEVEPTGNGTGPLQLYDVDDPIYLIYRVPLLPVAQDGRFLFVDSGDEEIHRFPYEILGLLEDYLRERVGDGWVNGLCIETKDPGNRIIRFRLEHGTSRGLVTIRRTLIAVLAADEPHPLRPTKIDRVRQEWALEDCQLPHDVNREAFIEVIGMAIAASMIREMIWSMIKPRPSVVGSFEPSFDIYEGERDHVDLAEVVADLHRYALDTDRDFTEGEADGTFVYLGESPLRLTELCGEVEFLEVTDC